MAQIKYVSQANMSTILGKIKATYVQKETGKGLSTNDLTNELLAKLNGIEEGANKTLIYDGLDSTSTTQALSANQGKVLDEKIKAINTNMENLGAGDMLKSKYDVDDNGQVDKADDADKLGGQAPAYYGTAEGVTEAKNAAAEAKAAADAKVASVAAGDASVTVGGTATAPTVAAQISKDADNILSLEADGLKATAPAAAEYSIVKAADSGDYAAVYNLTKDGVVVGASINIPKDMVVKSGSVVGDEIVLVLNDEAGTEIKIPVGSLIEYVTSGSQTGDMVVITVSDDHKVTATITDGTITLAKLTTEVQTAIGKAHTHKNLELLETYTQTEADLADAVTKKHSHANIEELNKIASGDKAKWDAVAADYVKGTEMVALTETEIEEIWNNA